MSAALLVLIVLAPLGMPVRAQTTDRASAASRLRDAERASAEGRLDVAIALYDAVAGGSGGSAAPGVLTDPASAVPAAVRADAQYRAAEATLALGLTAEAARRFEAFASAFPAHPRATDARIGLARTLLDRGDLVAARAAFVRAAETTADPDAAMRALLWSAEIALRQDDADGARAAYRRAYTAFPASPLAPAARYAEAFQLLRADRRADADAALAALDARYPDSPYARDVALAYADLTYAIGDWARLDALVTPRLASLSGDARARAAFLVGEARRQTGRLDAAAEAFEIAAADAAYARPATMGLAAVRRAQNRPREAADAYARVRTLGTGAASDTLGAEAAYAEGAARMAARDVPGALAAWARLAETWPTLALATDARYETGVAEYRRERWREAATAFEAFAERAPTGDDRLGDALVYAASARIASGDLASAERLFDRAERVATTPTARGAVAFQRATLLYRSGAFDRAFERFRALADAAPPTGLSPADARAAAARRVEATYWAAESAFSGGRPRDAVAYAERVRRDDPNGPYATASAYTRAHALLKQERLREAAEAFEAFIDETRATPETQRYRDEAHLRLGDLFLAQRRYLEAASAYARATREGRDYGLFGTGLAYDAAGSADRAERAWRQLLRDFPQSDWREEARYSLGLSAFRADRYDAAIAEYETLVREAPTDPLAAKALYGIGDAHVNAGRPRQAAEAYEGVLRRYPQSPFAADAAASLESVYADLGDAARGRAIVAAFERGATGEVADALRFRQAEAAYARGDADAARAGFTAVARGAADTALRTDAAFLLAELDASEGKTREAEAAFVRIMDGARHARQADAARRAGDLRLTRGDGAAALAAYDRLADLAGDDTRGRTAATVGQGRALLVLGRAADAATRVADAARAGDVDALVVQGRAAEALTRPDAAIEAYRRASADDGAAGAEATARLGALLLARGDAPAALAAVADAETRFDGFDTFVADALLVRARAHAAARDSAAARTAYEALEARFPGTPQAATAARERAALR